MKPETMTLLRQGFGGFFPSAFLARTESLAKPGQAPRAGRLAKEKKYCLF